jgi:hypothetical protein
VAANTESESTAALEQMRRVLKADVRRTGDWTEPELRRLKPV